jgi:hypothetical protein
MFSAVSIQFYRLAYVEKTNTIISWAKPLVWESYRLASVSSHRAWFRLVYSSYLLNNVIKLDLDNNPAKLATIYFIGSTNRLSVRPGCSNYTVYIATFWRYLEI